MAPTPLAVRCIALVMLATLLLDPAGQGGKVTDEAPILPYLQRLVYQ
jgi:hypothetical protein